MRVIGKSAPRIVAVPLVIALLAIAGCGGGSDTSNSGSTAAAGEAPKGGSAVTIKDFAYSPPSLTVPKGTTIEFTNEDSSNHTATSKSTGAFDTGTIGQGKSKAVTLSKPGTFAYFCSFHPFMQGTITVEG
jgi:plastocyanin